MPRHCTQELYTYNLKIYIFQVNSLKEDLKLAVNKIHMVLQSLQSLRDSTVCALELANCLGLGPPLLTRCALSTTHEAGWRDIYKELLSSTCRDFEHIHFQRITITYAFILNQQGLSPTMFL